MQAPGGMRTLISAGEVVLGGAGASLLAAKVANGQVFGVPAELVAAGACAAAALFAGSTYGKDLMFLAAGALTPYAAAKALQTMGPKIAGVPYYVGALPQGGHGQLQIPQGQQQQAYPNLMSAANVL